MEHDKRSPKDDYNQTSQLVNCIRGDCSTMLVFAKYQATYVPITIIVILSRWWTIQSDNGTASRSTFL